MDLLHTFDLHQHITGIIHRSGHALDLVITRSKDRDSIISSNLYADTPSEHSYVICDLCFLLPKLSKVELSTRKIIAISLER